jgi:AAA ATPase domain
MCGPVCATLLRMDGVLCPVVVGRSDELAALAGLVADAADGRGGFAALVGEAGVGKSRLAREAAALAADRGLLVLSGRAVPAGSPLPFRPLSEALLVASRGKKPPGAPELAGFGPQLARLVPDWGARNATDGADDSPVLVGEAVVRLLRVLGGTAGCLLVLEDLHWADPETLAVVDYLADTLAAERVLCLATTRPSGRRASRTCSTGCGAGGSARSCPSAHWRTPSAQTWCTPACRMPRSTLPCRPSSPSTATGCRS